MKGLGGKVFKKEIEKLINYFTDHRERMRYKTYQNTGLEIVSEAVESARIVLLFSKGQNSTVKDVLLPACKVYYRFVQHTSVAIGINCYL